MCGFTEKKIVSGVFASTVIQSVRTHADPRMQNQFPPNDDEKKHCFALLLVHSDRFSSKSMKSNGSKGSLKFT